MNSWYVVASSRTRLGAEHQAKHRMTYPCAVKGQKQKCGKIRRGSKIDDWYRIARWEIRAGAARERKEQIFTVQRSGLVDASIMDTISEIEDSKEYHKKCSAGER